MSETEILAFLKGMQFKKATFGVDKADVLEKMRELNNMYKQLLAETREQAPPATPQFDNKLAIAFETFMDKQLRFDAIVAEGEEKSAQMIALAEDRVAQVIRLAEEQARQLIADAKQEASAIIADAEGKAAAVAFENHKHLDDMLAQKKAYIQMLEKAKTDELRAFELEKSSAMDSLDQIRRAIESLDLADTEIPRKILHE